jgi:hypothetical protein
MALKQGDLAWLEHPVAKELLASKIPTRLAYVATDGAPRVLPIWLHWDGRQLVMGTQPGAEKLKALNRILRWCSQSITTLSRIRCC